MGFNPVSMGLGVVGGAVADIYGAKKQAETDKANLAAQQAQQAKVNGMASQYMTKAGQQDPFASMIMQFLGQSQGQNPSGFNLGDDPRLSAGQQNRMGGNGMYQYTPQDNGAFNYNSEQLGAAPSVDANAMSGLSQLAPSQMGAIANMTAPTVGAAPTTSAATVGAMPQMQAASVGPAPQVGSNQITGIQDLLNQNLGPAPTASAQQLNAPGAVSAQKIQTLGAIDLPQVAAPMAIGTSGYNAGQDGLMQMMNRDITPTRDSSIDPMLQSGMGQFDNSQLFKALAPMDNQLLDEQVSGLRGAAGSMGKRFGSSMMKDEMKMRGQFANQVGARNAGIQQQSFESAANRSLQGAGIQAGREQTFSQMPFQNAQLQLQAAGQLGGLTQQGQAMDLGAQQFNVQQNQQAQQFNAQNTINASLATQGLNAQIGQANAGNDLQANLANQQMQMQTGQSNQSAALQAALANQQLQGQYGLQGAQMNQQTGQFNAGNQLAMQQFNAQQGMQGNLANQQAMMQAMMQNAQFQQQVGQFNAQGAQQAALANAGYAQQTGQFNAGNQFQGQLANQQSQLQTGQQNQNLQYQQMLQNANLMQQGNQFNIGNALSMMQGNQQNSLQAALANQQMQGQYGLANQQAANQAGQFNAGMNMQNSQFAAQQGNIYNQLMMSGMLGAAGLQNQAQGNNAQMLGIMAGQQIPQQQTNPLYGAVGNAAQTLGMMPTMWSMLQQPKTQTPMNTMLSRLGG